jgi:hypothetical protein
MAATTLAWHWVLTPHKLSGGFITIKVAKVKGPINFSNTWFASLIAMLIYLLPRGFLFDGELVAQCAHN